MPVEMNLSETKPEGSGFVDEDCDCHLYIEKFEDFSATERPYLEFDFTVMAACNPRGEPLPQLANRKIKGSRFYITPAAVGRLLELACAIELYTKDQWKADKEAGLNPQIPFEDSIGREFCSPLRRKPWDDFSEKSAREKLEKAEAAGESDKIATWQRVLADKKGMMQVGGDKGFAFWALGDPEADHVPLDQMAIDRTAGHLPTKNGKTRRRGEKVTPAPKTSAPAAASRPAPSAAAAASTA